jgi:hypothetical protein
MPLATASIAGISVPNAFVAACSSFFSVVCGICKALSDSAWKECIRTGSFTLFILLDAVISACPEVLSVRIASVLPTSNAPMGWTLPVTLIGLAHTLKVTRSPILKVMGGDLLAEVATDKPARRTGTIALPSC